MGSHGKQLFSTGLGFALGASLTLLGCGGEPDEMLGGADAGSGGANGGSTGAMGGTTAGDTGGDMGGVTGGATGGLTAGPQAEGGAGSTGTPVLGDGKCAAITRDSPEAKGGVDVIFLLDTSGSMLHATQQVTANLASFIQEFEGTEADTRVVMITGSDPAAGSPVANQPDRYRFIQSEVDSAALYTVAIAQFPAYGDFLRPGAATQFVMITDDNDAVPPDVFQTEMRNLLGKSFTVHAIASEDANGLPCVSESALATNPLCAGLSFIPALCSAAAIGTNYNTLAAQTGGVQESVCTNDWAPVFAQLKEAVIEAVPLPCDYPIAEAKGEDYFNKNEVQIRYRSSSTSETEFPFSTEGAGGCGEGTGWYYDNPDDPKVIHLCPAACQSVQEGGSIDVVFGCPPQVLI